MYPRPPPSNPKWLDGKASLRSSAALLAVAIIIPEGALIRSGERARSCRRRFAPVGAKHTGGEKANGRDVNADVNL